VLTRIGGLDTFCSVQGQGEPVLLLHGWGVSSQSLAAVQELLGDSHRAVAVDLPGFGWSERPPAAWGTGEYARHVVGLMDALGLDRAAVLGHSFGGRVAIRMAAGHAPRVSRLVLVASAGIRPPRGIRYRVRVRSVKLVRELFGLRVWGRLGPRLIARLTERVGSRDYRAAGAMRPTLVKVVNEDLAPLLPAIRVPTLILWGDRDEEVPRSAMDRMAGAIPGARMVVFPGAGHFPFQDAPEAFARELRAFMVEGVEGAEGAGGDRG
jgi:pimeloyl-ACP methyl ester carboxylesterase